MTWDLLDAAHALCPRRIVLCGVARIDPPLVRELRHMGAEVLLIVRAADLSDRPRLVSVVHAATRAAAIGAAVHAAVHADAPQLQRLCAAAFSQGEVSCAVRRSSRCLLLASSLTARARRIVASVARRGLAEAPQLATLAAVRAALASAPSVIDLDAAMRRGALVDLSLEAPAECAALPRDDSTMVLDAGLGGLEHALLVLRARPRAARAAEQDGLGASEIPRGWCAAMITLVHADDYAFDWPGHVFPVAKYRLVKERLLAERLAQPGDFEVPPMLALDAVRCVHGAEYLQRLLELARDPRAALREFEIPISRQVIHAVLRHASGTLLACQRARARRSGQPGRRLPPRVPGPWRGVLLHQRHRLCGASPARLGRARPRGGVDLDLHQGNGTARCFAGDERVFTFSIHQEDLYPVPKEQSSLDVGLEGGAGDREYLGALETHLPRALAHRPDLVVYVAGADPFEQDQLGDLKLTHRGFERRDEMVFAALRARGLPVAVVLAGGYARAGSRTSSRSTPAWCAR
ncbi:MAG: histone deacetylase [Planctomycetota bacterium]